ncbi:type I-G CRISPR-associated protein, Cas3-extension family [Teichococcus aestuarii]|uniref:type I-G CRISPR-associated protein, Cas3-extension family n=1 Tax=Teichococcus aestuarii TaxID=568898 RepID=UPI0011B1F9E9|nr:hypothetical protein [Pseudoroseomonas aestuarii]
MIPAEAGTREDTQVVLGGLQGETLTGFLAALGVLRLLTEAGDGVKLFWNTQPPHHAVLEWGRPDGQSLEERLAGLLESRVAPLALFPGRKKIKEVSPEEYREALLEAQSLGDELLSDLLAALTSDATARVTKVEKPENGRKQRPPDPEGKTLAPVSALADPPWCALDGSQQKNLFLTVRRLQELVRPPVPKRGKEIASGLAERLRATLQGPWIEKDEKASLYLEPSLREHAYRWTNPTLDPMRFEGLANLLALVGLSLWPAVPEERRGEVVLGSPCCFEKGGGRVEVSWPIWRGALSLAAARRLILLRDITASVQPTNLAARGVTAVYRAEAYRLEKGAKVFGSSKAAWRREDEAA